MRKFIFFSIIILSLAGALIWGVLYGLAQTAVFAPDHLFFPLQDFAEQLHIKTTGDIVEKFNIQTDATNRRFVELSERINTPGENAAAAALSTAIDRLIELYALFDQSGDQNLRDGRVVILDLLDRVDALAQKYNLPLNSSSARLKALITKLVSLRDVLTNGQKSAKEVLNVIVPATPKDPNGQISIQSPIIQYIDPHIVFFPKGSVGAQHAFYPLIGKHAVLNCQSCHPNGIYHGTENTCSACHQKVVPVNHFPGECALCHTPEGWKPAHFDHTANQAQDCLVCHSSVRPVNHYPGQCSLCHSTSAWKPANFNHAAAGATDCQSCHTPQKPANHYPGQCSACHTINAWKPANFNHSVAGATDCQSCHEAKRPANHYSGQCSGCHTTNAWKPANFNHSVAGATDCQSCHAAKRPANHYSGQCSACHNTTAWKPANFNHSAAGATDCRSCHSQRAPAGHYTAQCSACHNTTAWKPANFNHSAAGATDCQSCHARPSPHFSGQCSQCHNTTAWSNVTFSHNFPMNHGNANSCTSCHPGGDSNWTCYNCHNQSEMVNQHNEKNISNIDGRCLECHPTGRNP